MHLIVAGNTAISALLATSYSSKLSSREIATVVAPILSTWWYASMLTARPFTASLLVSGLYQTNDSRVNVTVEEVPANGSLTVRGPGNPWPVHVVHSDILAGKVRS